MENKQDLSEISTKDLVEEISKREGVVNTIQVPPHAKVDIKTEGRAIVLVVID